MTKQPRTEHREEAIYSLREAADAEASTARLIPLLDIDEDPDQPRQVFEDPSADDDDVAGGFQDLVNSIKDQGIIQPLVVTREGDRFRILVGARRYRAAKILGLEAVPCLEREAPNRLARMLIQVAENHNRRGLSLHELANAISEALRLPETNGLTQAELAQRFGISRQTFSHLLALSKGPPTVRAAMRLRLITDTTTAQLFARLSAADQSRLFEDAKAQNRRLTRTEIKAAAKAPVHDDLAGDPNAAFTGAIALPDPSTLQPTQTGSPGAVTTKSRAPNQTDPPPRLLRDPTGPILAADLPPTEPGLIPLPMITRSQAEQLFAMLGAPPPPDDPRELAASFLEILG